MDAKAAIKETMSISNMVLGSYIGDLSDAELLKRPGQGCNHIAWQLGHLISSECGLLNSVQPGAAPTLPDGFEQNHSKENAGSDNAADFLSKQEYIDLAAKVHEAVTTCLDAYPAEQLDAPGPEHFRSMFPTMGSMFLLIATHPLMHAGQFVPVRRELGKPVVI
ncbi:MAG: DinB family protein [Planctomycetaceae bacterium]|nr:DinB family protein [Planctomycetaceae bacterium]